VSRDAAGGLVYRAGVPSAPDHLFAVVLAVLFPIRAALFGYRRLTMAEAQDVPRVRMWLYRQGIAIQWSLTAAAVALWVWQGRPWALLGVVPRLTWGLLGVAVGFAVVIPIVLVQRRKALDDDDALLKLRQRMRHIERMMPRSGEELRWFRRLAVTAGICEELLYRGYLVWYLTTWMAVVPAVLVASAVFGIGHLYQGPRGVALTAGVGVFMSAVYLLTGSLFAPMAIHAMMDLHAGHMGHAAFQGEERAPVPAVSEPATG
jgi:membrane protease YdiL (CAAX protease family)